MTEIDDLQKEIQEMQETLARDIAGLDKRDPSQRSQHINKCANKLLLIRTRIEAYELETLQLDRNAQAKHKEALGSLQAKAKELKADLDKRKADKREAAKNVALEEPKKLEEMNAQELIQTGDKYQQEGKDALQRIMQNINSADQKADHINLELYRQEEQMQKAKEKTQDIQSELKKAGKYLKYFAKQVYTDKILMCLIFLAIIAVIVIIILKIIKKNNISNSEDLVNALKS
jgi:SNARE protein